MRPCRLRDCPPVCPHERARKSSRDRSGVQQIFRAAQQLGHGPSGSTLPTPEEAAERHVISGTVTYRQRVALASGSIVEVRVEDATRTGTLTPAALLGSTRFEAAGQVPIPFEVDLPEGGTGRRAAYAVSARIYGPDGRLLFASDAPHRLSAAASTDRVRASDRTVRASEVKETWAVGERPAGRSDEAGRGPWRHSAPLQPRKPQREAQVWVKLAYSVSRRRIAGQC